MYHILDIGVIRYSNASMCLLSPLTFAFYKARVLLTYIIRQIWWYLGILSYYCVLNLCVYAFMTPKPYIGFYVSIKSLLTYCDLRRNDAHVAVL